MMRLHEVIIDIEQKCRKIQNLQDKELLVLNELRQIAFENMLRFDFIRDNQPVCQAMVRRTSIVIPILRLNLEEYLEIDNFGDDVFEEFTQIR
jgi:hypothetical protein